METPQKQTPDITSKSWDELKAQGLSPINFVGAGLDEATVPDNKRHLYDTVLAAEHSAVEAAAEEAQAAEAQALQDERDKFLAERAKARKDISDIAVRGSLAAAINEQGAKPNAELVSVGTYKDGYMTPREQEAFLDARRNNTPQ